jgi:ACS family tartrate transporter-like MFS transporter
MASGYSVGVVVATYAIAVIGHAAAQATFWLIPSDEFKGHIAEVGIAAIGSIGMIGAFIGPFAFGLARDYTGSYQTGLLSVSALYAVAITILMYSRTGTLSNRAREVEGPLSAGGSRAGAA